MLDIGKKISRADSAYLDLQTGCNQGGIFIVDDGFLHPDLTANCQRMRSVYTYTSQNKSKYRTSVRNLASELNGQVLSSICSFTMKRMSKSLNQEIKLAEEN